MGGTYPRLHLPPPRPKDQPTPSCLVDLEASCDSPLYMSKRDGVSYFDALSAPSCVRPWFGRPGLLANELLSIRGDLSLTWLESFVDSTGSGPLTADTRVFPILCCWPMGFSWSSAIAQDVMLSTARAAGLQDRNLLSNDRATPDPSDVDEFFAVCTDDVMHWARDTERAQSRLKRLGEVWQRVGIGRKPEKDLDWSLFGTAIGVDFNGRDGYLDANASKQLKVMNETVNVLRGEMASPLKVRELMGSLQWFDLLARSKLAVYSDVYSFMELADQNVEQIVPSAVKGELHASLALAPFWSADLGRKFAPFISATDASSDFGFGVSVASASPSLARKVAALAEKRGDYVTLASTTPESLDKLPKARLGNPFSLGLHPANFKDVLSIRASQPAHINVLEAEAFLMWMKWFLRSAKRHSSRTVCLVDSKVVLFAVSKGRSSSPALLRVLRRIGALTLAGNLHVRLVYIPTEYNPSDGASRGVRARPNDRSYRNRANKVKYSIKKSRFHERLRKTVDNSPYRDELRELVADDVDFWNFRNFK